MKTSIIFLVFFLFLFTSQSAILKGNIKDAVYGGVKFADITLTGKTGDFTVSTSNGKFEAELPKGNYYLKVNHPFFIPYGIYICLEDDQEIEIVLTRFDKIFSGEIICTVGISKDGFCGGYCYDGSFLGDCQFLGKGDITTLDSFPETEFQELNYPEIRFTLSLQDRILILNRDKMCNHLSAENKLELKEEDVDEFYRSYFKN